MSLLLLLVVATIYFLFSIPVAILWNEWQQRRRRRWRRRWWQRLRPTGHNWKTNALFPHTITFNSIAVLFNSNRNKIHVFVCACARVCETWLLCLNSSLLVVVVVVWYLKLPRMCRTTNYNDIYLICLNCLQMLDQWSHFIHTRSNSISVSILFFSVFFFLADVTATFRRRQYRARRKREIRNK